MKKQVTFLLMFGLSLVLMSGAVMAANAITVNTPAADASTSGAAYLLNATLDTNSVNVTNVTFAYQLTGTSTWTIIGEVINTSAQQLEYTLSWDTTAFVDSINIIINATGYNTTTGAAAQTTDVSTGVSIDNGVPTAAFGSTSLQQYSGITGADSFTFAVAADNTICIENCTATMNNVVSSVFAASGEACSNSFTASDFSITADNEYLYHLSAIDANGNETNSSQRQLNFYARAGGGLASGGGTSAATDPAVIDTSSTGTGPTAAALAQPNAVSRFFNSIADFFKNLFTRGN